MVERMQNCIRGIFQQYLCIFFYSCSAASAVIHLFYTVHSISFCHLVALFSLDSNVVHAA